MTYPDHLIEALKESLSAARRDLDAARAENARLRLAIQVLTRLVREDYPTRSLVWIAHVWGSATDEELAALQTIEEGA